MDERERILRTLFGSLDDYKPNVPQGLNDYIPNLHPHYTNERFKNAQLVWGSEDAKTWDYSDRIIEWYGTKTCHEAWEQAEREGFKRDTAGFIQRYLQIVYGNDNLRLIGIMAGFNWSNGYPYNVYGYGGHK